MNHRFHRGRIARFKFAASRALTALLLALALFGVTNALGPTANAHADIIPDSDRVGSRASAGSTPPSTGFVPNPQALRASQVSFSRTKLLAVDLSAYNPQVRSQLSVNSCTAWATGYYLRGWYAKRDGYASSGFTAMYTYSQIALAHGDFSTHANSGSTFKENLDIQVSQGIDTAGDFFNDFADIKLPISAQRTNAATYKIAGYTDIFNDGTSSFAGWIKATLASGNPIAIGFPIYPEFRNATAATSYIVAPTAGETSEGLHATFAYAYDQTGLKIENQWDNWGNAGYAVLSWDFVNRYALEAVSIIPPSPPPTWQQLPSGATDISVGAISNAGGGEVWAIGTNPVYGGYGISHWNPLTWQWEPVNGGAVRIAVDAFLAPWVVNSFGNIFRWTGGTWQQMPGSARDIAVSSNGSIWIVGWSTSDLRCRPSPCDGGIYRWTGASWQQFPGSANRITVDQWDDPWVVTSGGGISHWTGSAWQQLPGAATDVACGSGTVYLAGIACWVTGTDGGIYHWNSTAPPLSHVESGSWEAVAGSAVAITVAPSHNPWVANGGGSIFEYVD